ncbi:MAG: hypothetical protein H0W70_12150 [Actinobacteria bacterium]|nr:hypothetical protein [Actinomycetota bacterium]
MTTATSVTVPPPKAAKEVSAPGETLFGFRTESTTTTAVAVALLLAGAVAAWFAGRWWFFVGLAVIVLGLAFLDGREALHQHDESRAGLVAAAVALAVAHLVAGGLSLELARRTRRVGTAER